MKTIEFKTPNWRLIRLILSLALLRREPVTIRKGFNFIEKNYDLTPLFDDFRRIVFETGAGILGDSDGDIYFEPEGIHHGTYSFETGKYSAISEIELLLLPSLFYGGFRSVINYSGVTHSHISYPTTFLKETLFGFLESTGHYASMNLRRFGFYGSGGGLAESRIYPAEPANCGDIFSDHDVSIEGVKIFMAKMNMEMATREKEFMIKNTGVDENRVQIMEIVDADGFGNSIQVYLKYGNVNVILSRDMEFYNSAGDFVFDEARYYTALAALVRETENLLKMKRLPDYVADEIIPYLILSGSYIPEELRNTECFRVCGEIL